MCPLPSPRPSALVPVALLVAACSGWEGSGDGTADPRLSPVDVVVRGCEEPCANAEERHACVERECQDVYVACFGASYRSGNYAGGVCQSGLECLATTPFPCQADCSPTPTCFDCVANQLVTCAQNADCPGLECD